MNVIERFRSLPLRPLPHPSKVLDKYDYAIVKVYDEYELWRDNFKKHRDEINLQCRRIAEDNYRALLTHYVMETEEFKSVKSKETEKKEKIDV